MSIAENRRLQQDSDEEFEGSSWLSDFVRNIPDAGNLSSGGTRLREQRLKKRKRADRVKRDKAETNMRAKGANAASNKRGAGGPGLSPAEALKGAQLMLRRLRPRLGVRRL